MSLYCFLEKVRCKPHLSEGSLVRFFALIIFFLILAFFNLSPCALSFWPHSISFCNFGHMCSFLSCLMPCDKTFVIFAIKFNSGYISRKSTNKYRKLNSCHPKMTEINYGFLVSKETVVLRRWGISKQKFGFIKRVDKC